MQVRWAGKTKEIELSGSTDELRELAGVLREDRSTVPLDATADPAPYSKALVSMKTRRTSGLVTISVPTDRDDILIVEGGSAALRILAENIKAFADENDPSTHMHLEHVPDSEFLSPGSSSLVITLRT